jgi:hypothetical protein
MTIPSSTTSQPLYTLNESEDHNSDVSSAVFYDGDSAYEADDDDDVESTKSVEPDIWRHVQENGRTYPAYGNGKYFLPNDENEQDRWDWQHHLYCLTFDNKLYFCPGSVQPNCVLNLGTSTGIWAIDFADTHPAAEVLGIDLSPIQL